jgi:hypothetical protein
MSQQIKQALKSNALYSPLPRSLAKVVGLIADHLSADCNCELAWPGEAYMAKKMGLSVRQTIRLLNQVKLIGCFEILLMKRRELQSLARRNYDYDVDIGHIEHKINTYRPNPKHFLCRPDVVTEQDWLPLLEKLEHARRTTRGAGRRNDRTQQLTEVHDRTHGVIPLRGHRVSYHSNDTGVIPSQEGIPDSGGSQEEITEITNKTDAVYNHYRVSGNGYSLRRNSSPIAAGREEADGRPYRDDADWEEPATPPLLGDDDYDLPPQAADPELSRASRQPRQFKVEIFSIKGSRGGGGCSEAAGGEEAPTPAATTSATATPAAATSATLTPDANGVLPNGKTI